MLIWCLGGGRCQVADINALCLSLNGRAYVLLIIGLCIGGFCCFSGFKWIILFFKVVSWEKFFYGS